MIYSIVKFFDRIFHAPVAHAHCDVPCGVYDPNAAFYYAKGVAKMVEKILALERPAASASKEEWDAYHNSLSRFVIVKEEQARKCKEELLILWTDYFKNEHIAMFPNLHETFWRAAKLCSRIKQTVDKDATDELLALIHEISVMFLRAEEAKKKV